VDLVGDRLAIIVAYRLVGRCGLKLIKLFEGF